MADISQIILPNGTTYDIKDPVARAAASEGGGGGIFYGVCSTGASTQTKVVDIDDFELYTGVPVLVKFSEAQTYNGQPKLNVSGTGASNITVRETTAGFRYQWYAGECVLFIYDGTNWLAVDGAPATTTYYGVTKLSSAVDSTSTVLAATPSAVKQAYDLANTANTNVSNKQNKYTITTATLSASGWSNKTYSFEGTYPNATYDIEIELNGDSITDTQHTAWSAARLVGSASSNVLTAVGEVPTVDIPIIVKVVIK